MCQCTRYPKTISGVIFVFILSWLQPLSYNTIRSCIINGIHFRFQVITSSIFSFTIPKEVNPKPNFVATPIRNPDHMNHLFSPVGTSRDSRLSSWVLCFSSPKLWGDNYKEKLETTNLVEFHSISLTRFTPHETNEGTAGLVVKSFATQRSPNTICSSSTFASSGSQKTASWSSLAEDWNNRLPYSLQPITTTGKHNLDVSKNRGTPKWMVYNGKPY